MDFNCWRPTDPGAVNVVRDSGEEAVAPNFSRL
jgi:hypothetical protein